jgi:uncharacterized protein
MIKKVFLKIINLYQDFISPSLPKSCRFWPSCSDYSVLAIEKYGAKKGLIKGVLRILRCSPWSKGGIDLP